MISKIYRNLMIFYFDFCENIIEKWNRLTMEVSQRLLPDFKEISVNRSQI